MAKRVPVRIIQQGLTWWHEEGATPGTPTRSPGPIDGLWGPRTAEALEGFLAAQHPDELGRLVIEVDPRDREIILPGYLGEDLASMAVQYEARQAARGASQPSAQGAPGGGSPPAIRVPQETIPSLAPRMAPTTKWALGILVVGGLAALGYWYWRSRR